MIKRRSKNESFENLSRVTSNDTPVVDGVMDVVMADAVVDHANKEKQLEEVNDELQKAAEGVAPEETEEPKVGVENDFTAKLVLDESLTDFSIDEAVTSEPVKDGRSRKVYDEDDEDDYLDYDMFDFIYGLVTDCWPKPLNPLDHRLRKFMYIGSDKYDVDDDFTGDLSDNHSQVGTTGDSIEVYSNNETDFNDIITICDMYKFSYDGPNPKKSKSSYWNYSLTINVPLMDNDYPYMVEDYFETIGKTMEDVMPADFCKQYRKRQDRIKKEAEKYISEKEVDKMVNAAITAAAQDNTEPLEVHLKRLYTDLDAAGLTYQKFKVKKTFMDAFDDGDEEDDE